MDSYQDSCSGKPIFLFPNKTAIQTCGPTPLYQSKDPDSHYLFSPLFLKKKEKKNEETLTTIKQLTTMLCQAFPRR